MRDAVLTGHERWRRARVLMDMRTVEYLQTIIMRGPWGFDLYEVSRPLRVFYSSRLLLYTSWPGARDTLMKQHSSDLLKTLTSGTFIVQPSHTRQLF